MIEGVLGFPAKLQPRALPYRNCFEKAQVKIVCPAGEQSVASHRRSVGRSSPLHPINVGRVDARIDVRIAVASWASLRFCGQDGAAVWRRLLIADVRTVHLSPAILIAIRAIDNRVRRSRLECR